MAANSAQESNSDYSPVKEFQIHRRNYDGFLKILKRSTVAVAIVAAIVVYIIAY